MNDEDAAHPNQFRVWVLRCGTLVEHGNPFLSPYFPTVEDLASGS
jgi:Immunity protein 7